MMQQVGTPSYMQPTPSASAVNIQIFEPKAYAAPNNTPDAQGQIWNYPQNSLYTAPYMNQYQQFMPMQAPVMPPMMPQAPAMSPMMPQAPAMSPMMPQAPVMSPMMPQAPQVSPYAPQYDTSVTQPVEAQPMPAPVINAQPQAPQTVATPQAAPVQPSPAPAPAPTPAIDVNSLVQGLTSADPLAQEDAITKIANLSQGDPEMQNAVLTEPVMKGLAAIAGQDTSGLEGPSEAQMAAINKAAQGQTLTPEEQALTEKLAPKTVADKNKVISMFTLAMLQKNQRDEVDRYNQTQDPQNQVPQPKLSDLIGYNEIENAAKNAADQEVRLAAIQALSYAARPEDKATLEGVLQGAMNSEEPLIKQAATEVLTNVGSELAAPQQQEVDLSKMSKKERKAYEKAQKKAEKENKKVA